MTLVGITREADKIIDLTESAQSKGIEIVPIPLTTTIYYPVTITNLDTFDWVIFSSQSGVDSFFNIINKSDYELLNGINFAVVGDKTEKWLNNFGFNADFKPTESYGDNLFNEFLNNFNGRKFKVLYVRAEKVNFEPESLFENSSIDFNSIITYKTDLNILDKNLISKFDNNDYIFFTSPSNVESFSEQFGKPNSKVIAIGKTTAKKMRDYHWENIITMKYPDIDKIWEYL